MCRGPIQPLKARTFESRSSGSPTIVNFPVRNLEMGAYTASGESKKYHLMSSVQHEGTPDAGSYRAFVHFRANDSWYEMQDLHVNGVHPQLISVSESYIQVWRQAED
jgi:U4/U6.U5 tri-snRNP-associated protein 2